MHEAETRLECAAGDSVQAKLQGSWQWEKGRRVRAKKNKTRPDQTTAKQNETRQDRTKTVKSSVGLKIHQWIGERKDNTGQQRKRQHEDKITQDNTGQHKTR